MEPGDLVLLQVGDDGEGGGELAGVGDDQRRVDPLRFEPGTEIAEILADRAHQPRPLAEQRHGVGDVRADAAAAHLLVFHQEADADLTLLREDVLQEPAGIFHDVVGCDGTGDDDGHGTS